MNTGEEAQTTGKANQMIENDLSSCQIIHKVDLKTGKERTEWAIKVKHQNPRMGMIVAQELDDEMRRKYGN